MALAGRSMRRSSGGSRVLVAALVLTLIVLLIDASIKSRSQTPVQQLSSQAWIDQTLPLIRASTEQGQQINAVRTGGLTMSAAAIASQVKQTAAAAAATYHQAKELGPPSSLASAGGLLDACLLLREKAADNVAKALVSGLSGPAVPAAATTTALVEAGQSFQLGDQVYTVFTQTLAGLQLTMPASTWDLDPSLYQSATLSVYLASLRSATNLTPVHRVEVEAVSTTPRAESVVKGIQVLPDLGSISVDVVVANVGNQVESNLTVTAGILPAVKAPSAKEFLSPLQPGAAQSLTIGALYPVVGQPTVLTVTVSGEAAAAVQPASKTLTFEMPSAGSTLTTTSTTAVPTTSSSSSSTSTPSTTLAPK